MTAAPELTPVQRITLRPAEIAAALGIGMNHVNDLIQSGAFPSWTLGRTRLARVADVEAWAEQQAAKAAGTPVTDVGE